MHLKPQCPHPENSDSPVSSSCFPVFNALHLFRVRTSFPSTYAGASPLCRNSSPGLECRHPFNPFALGSGLNLFTDARGFQEAFEGVGWGFRGMYPSEPPANPQPTPRQPPGNPLGRANGLRREKQEDWLTKLNS